MCSLFERAAPPPFSKPMASMAYNPNDSLIDLSMLYDARAAAAHTTVASLDRQAGELRACIQQVRLKFI